jgi:FKBP-type peptidyl-prolyl cis-trans isomerase
MILFLLMSLAAWQEGEKAPEPLPLDMAKVSYIIGNQMGKNLKRDKIELDVDQFLDGLTDAGQEKSKISEEEMRNIMRDFQTAMRERSLVERKAASEKNQQEADKFLAENKAKEGVVTLPSGLQYKVLREGTGKQPTTDDKVRTHYSGKLLDGTEFDSSYKRNTPMDFQVTRVITGWTEALLLMKEGAKWELYIPPNLAYGERGSSNIPPNSALVFEVELLEILPAATVEDHEGHDHKPDEHP